MAVGRAVRGRKGRDRLLDGGGRQRLEPGGEGGHGQLDLLADLEQGLTDDEAVDEQLGGVVAQRAAVRRVVGERPGAAEEAGEVGALVRRAAQARVLLAQQDHLRVQCRQRLGVGAGRAERDRAGAPSVHGAITVKGRCRGPLRSRPLAALTASRYLRGASGRAGRPKRPVKRTTPVPARAARVSVPTVIQCRLGPCPASRCTRRRTVAAWLSRQLIRAPSSRVPWTARRCASRKRRGVIRTAVRRSAALAPFVVLPGPRPRPSPAAGGGGGGAGATAPVGAEAAWLTEATGSPAATTARRR